MQRMQRVAPASSGSAQESHFVPPIDGSDDQHAPQQEAFRSRHGSSSPQTTHEACRTIRAVSRPNEERAANTRRIVTFQFRAQRGINRGAARTFGLNYFARS